MTGWTADQLEQIGSAHELRVATHTADGSWRRAVPIWVVRVGDEVYVRTWYRRTTGWHARAVAEQEARIEVPGVEAEVTVHDVGPGDADVRASVDAAYREKYAAGASSMVTDEAAGTTLRLDRT